MVLIENLIVLLIIIVMVIMFILVNLIAIIIIITIIMIVIAIIVIIIIKHQVVFWLSQVTTPFINFLANLEHLNFSKYQS